MSIDSATLAGRIDAVLPQTQCRQCGFAGCLPYATAIAEGRATIDRCPPGGDAGIAKLAAVTGHAPLPLDTRYGITRPLSLAMIEEAACIGCTLCIQACPVDAIVGGAKRMHVVVAELCTGCELCVPPCPVDCIAMIEAPFAWDDHRAAAARTRHRARERRLARLAAQRTPTPQPGSAGNTVARKNTILAAAVERARVLAERRRAAREAP
jgi:electron transport complex protein RnfB